jgi:Firmicute plasmid replication protein (RepL)
MENKKIYQTETKTIIDHQTGEILQTEHQQKGFVEKEPDYVKLYLQDVARLKDLSPSASSLMTLIIRSMGYNNLFFAFKPLKEMFCEELNMPMNTLNKQIERLKNSGILLPIPNKRGCYLVDPNLFARGSWNDIKQLRLVIDYNIDGSRTLSSNAPAQLKQLSFGF